MCAYAKGVIIAGINTFTAMEDEFAYKGAEVSAPFYFLYF